MPEVERMSIVLHDDELDRRAAVVRRGRRTVPHLAARRGAGPRPAPTRSPRSPPTSVSSRCWRRRSPPRRTRTASTSEEYDEVARRPVAGAAGLDPRAADPAAPATARAGAAADARLPGHRARPRRAHRRRCLGAAAGRAARDPRAAAGTGRAPCRWPGCRSRTATRSSVDRAVVIGRAPEARRFNDTEQPRLVTVPSPHLEISSTHIEVRPGHRRRPRHRGRDRPRLHQRDRARAARARPRGPVARGRGAADPRCDHRSRRRRDHQGHQSLTRP